VAGKVAGSVIALLEMLSKARPSARGRARGVLSGKPVLAWPGVPGAGTLHGVRCSLCIVHSEQLAASCVQPVCRSTISCRARGGMHKTCLPTGCTYRVQDCAPCSDRCETKLAVLARVCVSRANCRFVSCHTGPEVKLRQESPTSSCSQDAWSAWTSPNKEQQSQACL